MTRYRRLNSRQKRSRYGLHIICLSNRPQKLASSTINCGVKSFDDAGCLETGCTRVGTVLISCARLQACRDEERATDGRVAEQMQKSHEDMSAKISSMQEDIRNLRTANRKLSKQHSTASLLKSLPPPPRRGTRESLIGTSHDQRSHRSTAEHPLSASADTVLLQVLCTTPVQHICSQLVARYNSVMPCC